MANPVIRVQQLLKRYGKFVAVKGIDFEVWPGEIFGLIGPDGAGKTTTFHILGGVMEATGGNVQVLGKQPRDARLAIGYLTQQFSLYLDLSIDENLRYSAGLRQVPSDVLQQRRAKYLGLMSLEQFGDRLAGDLSGGMKQKLALCCALISQPDILLLDEPTTGVDPVSRREFWDILAAVAAEGVTVVVATPYLDEAERCHRIALMYEGKIEQVGSLTALRQELGLQRLEVRTPDIAAAEQALQGGREDRAIADIQTFGDRLDILVSDVEVGKVAVQRLLHRHCLTLESLETAPTTLENVFVARLRQAGEDPPFLPFPRIQTTARPVKGAVAIGARDLRKVFGSFPAVKAVSLEIRYGEIYGLLGANGAGKTTTIKMLCGLLKASSGTMVLAGNTHNLRSGALRQRIGYMSQKFTLYDDLTILQNLEFYCGVYGIPRSLRRRKIDWVLEICGLEGREQMLTGQLPGGWKQRVAFGASVMHEPEILFLDEPTSGVDPLARRQFWRLINDFARQGTAILVTTHYLEEAEQCNRMGLMVAGEMVMQGSPSEIKAAQPGQLLEVVVDKTQEGSSLLKSKLAGWRVSIFGDRLHLVLDNPDAEIPAICQELQASGIEVKSLRPIPFSLEDAFIGTVQRAQEREG
ncbi:ABC transporter ATP-binding protein [Desertifilum sp. FACHB-1129]|uniref:ABC transporter ATP-binding protein n=1 Tax=Desertifilum tharense IPPAS B-1220 TaxID=1781255 RepID=A0A1E5QM74_9CYAN|nr:MULTISPECIES: ATP-binding cassette domain-containing protein [Desertifilum]MDA0213351.1 ATP-binding cassette domain-containing protein [Cyanobacteria bacterium FC1]MBD2313712.1 ABC transporter ATP-binding protein [Desertifilum sp. FACHB-1129]MBD2325006.1 ABC transporter ATP-binding protein [Desertifilum sp. FACHB-866]MBD2335145.1 ABC transporter ATP-binding protein [Desertifilum sp. FACHB-868]OEJ75740.1 ABC transporter ATP-binding protein [Desertifilum tharense IPPAS B-1220]